MSKPIVLCLTDTHLKKGNEIVVKSIFKQAIRKCNQLKIDRICHFGDFFSSREAQPLDVLSEALEIREMIFDSGLKFDIIPGNHDKVSLTSERSYLDVLADDYFRVHKSTNSIQVAKDLYVVLVPYFKENKNYTQYLDQAVSLANSSPDKKFILGTHIATNSVRNNDGSIVENDLTNDKFSCFHSVFIGHYHNQSIIGDNIYYIGSAYQANFGEDVNKGFTILNEDGSHYFIQSEFPEFKHIKVNIGDLSKKEIKALKEDLKDSENNIRITIEGTKEECESFDRKSLQEIGIDVKFDKSDINVSHEDEFVAFDRNNISLFFDNFVQLNNLKNVEIGKKYLSKIL